MRRPIWSFRHSPLQGAPSVLAGLLVWNVGNYAFFVIAGRSLGPESYATVAALLAATMLVQVPAGAVQVGMSRRVAELGTDRRAGSDALLMHSIPRCIAAGLALAAITFAVTWIVAPSLPKFAVVATSIAVAPIPLFSLALGALQGEHRFGGFSASVSMLGLPRPVALLLFLPLFADVTAAMAASAVTIVLAAAAATALAWPGRQGNRARPDAKASWVALRRTLAPLAIGLSGIAVLINLDVIVARASLPERIAGLFGAVAILAKAIVIIPQTAAWVLLPRIAQADAAGQPTNRFLVLGAGVSILGGTVATTVALAFGRPIVTLVFGAEYADGGQYLAPLIATATLTGLLLLLMNHQLGRNVDSFVWVIAGLAFIEGLVFAVLHDSVTMILTTEAILAVVGVVGYEVRYGRTDGGISRSIRAVAHGATRKSRQAPAT